MLTDLYIRDFAIVHELALSFGPGLSVLTGETGAGKSIMIDALALALGERADTAVIRTGCTRAEISARFEVMPGQTAAAWLKEQDLFNDGECILRRVVEVERPSKGFVNGRPVAMQMLRELGELLVDIHGQHDHQSLLKRDAQRALLDAYAGLTATCARLAAQYEELHGLQARLDDLRRRAADKSARLELLRYQRDELLALDLAADEVPRLEEEYARLANGAEILKGVQEANQLLTEAEEGAATQLLAQAIKKLDALSQFDPKLVQYTGPLNEAMIQVEEMGAELRSYFDSLELDPRRLEWLDQRLSTVYALARKHGVQPNELAAILNRLEGELSELADVEQSEERLEARIEEARGAWLQTARSVSEKRHASAQKLGRDVSVQMARLGMPGGRFEIALVALPVDELSRHGLEQVEFQVSANPGQPLKPINKVASGGELSRISLALQVCAAGLSQVPTLIFDEVDVGIGGAVAEIVGQQLHAISQGNQVLCITHLGQVAAQGDQHYQVSKASEKGATFTQIQQLSRKERVQEIARMIGGVDINARTLALAKEMLSHGDT